MSDADAFPKPAERRLPACPGAPARGAAPMRAARG